MNYMEKNCLLQNSCSGALRRVDEKSHHLLRTPFSAPLNIGACHEQAPNLSEGRVEWRRERDSNPRYAFWAYTRLAGERLQPTRPSLLKYSVECRVQSVEKRSSYGDLQPALDLMNKRYKLATQNIKVKRQGSLSTALIQSPRSKGQRKHYNR